MKSAEKLVTEPCHQGCPFCWLNSLLARVLPAWFPGVERTRRREDEAQRAAFESERERRWAENDARREQKAKLWEGLRDGLTGPVTFSGHLHSGRPVLGPVMPIGGFTANTWYTIRDGTHIYRDGQLLGVLTRDQQGRYTVQGMAPLAPNMGVYGVKPDPDMSDKRPSIDGRKRPVDPDFEPARYFTPEAIDRHTTVVLTEKGEPPERSGDLPPERDPYIRQRYRTTAGISTPTNEELAAAGPSVGEQLAQRMHDGPAYREEDAKMKEVPPLSGMKDPADGRCDFLSGVSKTRCLLERHHTGAHCVDTEPWSPPPETCGWVIAAGDVCVLPKGHAMAHASRPLVGGVGTIEDDPFFDTASVTVDIRALQHRITALEERQTKMDQQLVGLASQTKRFGL